jgi:hypothetical protein
VISQRAPGAAAAAAPRRAEEAEREREEEEEEAMDARGRALSAREEELLGLLAGFPDGEGGSDRELSFSDFVEAGDRPGAHRHLTDYHCSTPSLRRQDAASKQEQQKAAVPERRRRSGGSRGSCRGSGDGVLLNFYVPPGLRLTRSVTAARSGLGPPPPKAAAAGKARSVANRLILYFTGC